MKVIFYSAKSYDRRFTEEANEDFGHELVFIEPRLGEETAPLAHGYPAVSMFVNDVADSNVLRILKEGGTRLTALRCSGFNNVDLEAAKELGICVVRVPAYSPSAVAEHAVGLALALNRNIHRSHARVREGNFALDGLMGFDMRGKTAGIIGAGRIGSITATILKEGFGCEVLAHDVQPNQEMVEKDIGFVELPELLSSSDIISLHCPLTPDTYHLIDSKAISQLKPGVMLVNTSRGALIDTMAVIEALKSGQIGSLGIDVYEEEADLFFEDLSNKVIQDDVFARLLTFPNVIITGHQAYFTREALTEIARTTLNNIYEYENNKACANAVHCGLVRKSAR